MDIFTATDEQIFAAKQFNNNMVAIRNMAPDDIHEIAALERELFPSPWSQESFREELLNNISTTYVLAYNLRIIGYAVFWLFAEELHITKIAVSPHYRNMGIASWAVQLICEQARLLDAKEAFIEVRQSNDSAIHLYKKCGFAMMGRRKNYYQNPPEDALLMQATLQCCG